MASLYGANMTRQDILQRVGDLSQIAGVSRVTLAEGKEAGVEAVQFRTGTGFSFTVLPGRGMDISNAEYRGKALGWKSPTGDSHAAYYEPEGLGWLWGFFGGLLTTCGLTAVGAPCEDDDEELGLHGRMSHIPASGVSAEGEWQGDDYVMTARGKVREARLFGPNLLLSREIAATMGASKLTIRDRVENCGWDTQPHMILYHVNGGWPAIDEGTELLAAADSWCPRDADAEVGKDEARQMQGPTAGFAERCYLCDLKTDGDGFSQTALVNRACEGGFGFYMRWRKDQLPLFTQWKMNGQGAYVCGMEPGNCYPLGRDVEREAGRLQFLEPGEVREYELEIGVLDGTDAIAAFEQRVEAMG